MDLLYYVIIERRARGDASLKQGLKARRVYMLIVNRVTKKYGKNVACKEVSFTLEPGSLTVLLGPNGAGKSTIIKSIIGFLKYEGEITVNGYLNKTSEARRIMGYIPELPALYPNLTVIEHMEFIARAYKMTNYKDRIEMLLDKFELSDKKKKFGDELSKGMQQKLNLYIGLLPDPDIILMDEPLLGLDPHAIKELKNYIEELRQAGKTMLISTHIIDSVDMLWDRTVIMQNGEVRANVSRTEIESAGKTLEDQFFLVTEGISPSSVKAPAEGEASEGNAENGSGESAFEAETSGADAKGADK